MSIVVINYPLRHHKSLHHHTPPHVHAHAHAHVHHRHPQKPPRPPTPTPAPPSSAEDSTALALYRSQTGGLLG